MILLSSPNPAHWSECCIPLTVRPQHLIDHPGRSPPGGRLETSENFEQAAIREFCEELGVDRFPGRLIGPLLPLWVFNSDYRLQPFVAIHTGRLDYRPCPREVARVIRLPIAALCGESPPTGDTAVQQSRFSRGGVSWRAGIFEYQQDQIWGATAIVLAELAALLALWTEADWPARVRPHPAQFVQPGPSGLDRLRRSRVRIVGGLRSNPSGMV